ncbi:MAG: RHS repeat-associated core domain-containing protein, partial [Gemmataceae bacterium]
PDVLFARVAAGGTTAWYLRDNINSVRQVVSPTGTVLDAVTYDSFGNILSETNPANGDRFKYTGREYDAELGIYYYRARYYDPATGRFLGEDPLGFAAGDANFYRYVGNQPTGRIDPMGLDWSDRVAGWIGVDNVRSWDNVLGDYRTGWFAQGSNYFAGYSDSLSFGLTSYFRQGLGYDSVVDYSGGAYLGGQVTGMGHSFLLGYGAAGRVPQTGIWAYRAAQGYTVAGSVYGVGHSSYVLATDPQNFGFTDALGFVPLGGYVTSKGLTAARMWWQSRPFAPANVVRCFPPDTLVSTEAGLRPIAQVEAGERVWAYDFQAGVWRLCVVECRHDAEYDGPLVTLDVGVGEVTATAYHPFWVVEGQDLESRPALRHVDVSEDRDEALPGRWVNSHDLREGDVVFLRDRGPVTVRRVWQRSERTPVCNLTVQGLHTFAVGEMQILVHNMSGTSGQPPLRSIHPDSSLSRASLDFWGRKSTPEIIDSLRPGQAEALRVYPDGRIANGNTRIKILRERGVDVDALPREIHNP